MIQAFIIFIIILLGFLVLHLYPTKMTVKEITLSAMFIVITLICKRFFSVLIPLFGVESFKISIEYIPLMIAGFILSPSIAFFIGLSCDLIGLIIVPTGFPFFGFTLTMICVSTIPSIISHSLEHIDEKIVVNLTRILLIIIGLLGMIYINTLNHFNISDVTITLTHSYKIILSMIILMMIIFVMIIMKVISTRLQIIELKEFSLWCISVILVEGLCTLVLTPLWLSLMYSIPFITSFCIRVIKEVFILPLELFVGYIILKTIKKVIKRV